MGKQCIILFTDKFLVALSVQFGFTNAVDGTTARWYWPAEATAIDVPGLDPASALAFVLSRQQLQSQLPDSVLRLLLPYFRRAEAVLDQDGNHRLGAWRDKVRAIVRGPRQVIPVVDRRVHAAVTDALLRGCKLKATYQGRSASDEKDIELSPLGLVLRDGVMYLVATAWNYEDPLQFALHRFASADVHEVPAVVSDGFSLDRYIEEQRAFSYPQGHEPIALIAEFDASSATHLREQPLSDDQNVEQLLNGKVRLSATVSDTADLRWWLLGYGSDVEVLSPDTLRAEFAQVAAALWSRYKTSRNDVASHKQNTT